MNATDFLLELTESWDFNDLIEIRCTPVKQNISYKLIEEFARKHKIYMNEKRSLFFEMKQLEFIEKFLRYADGHFSQYEKVCYSVNPRQKDKNGIIITSGLDRTNKICTIVLDVEEVEKEDEILEEKQKRLDAYILTLEKKITHDFGLTFPIKVHSGRGRHLIYRIDPVTVTKPRRKWLKSQLETLFAQVETDEFHIDGAVKDITRVLGLPGSSNLKWNRMVEVLELNSSITPFKIKSKRNVKRKMSNTTVKYRGDFFHSLEWIAFTNNPPEGEIQVRLVFALKLLLKDNFPKMDHTLVEAKAYEVWGEQWSINPDQGTEGKKWSPFIILNYCKKHIDWVQKNPVVKSKYEDYKDAFFSIK